MAKDDYHVLVYRILAYLYACLKESEKPDLEYLRYGTDKFPIGEAYWHYILRNLCRDGYIEGVSLVPILGLEGDGVKILPCVSITPKGIEYLQDNSKMQMAKNFLKEMKESIPGL